MSPSSHLSTDGTLGVMTTVDIRQIHVWTFIALLLSRFFPVVTWITNHHKMFEHIRLMTRLCLTLYVTKHLFNSNHGRYPRQFDQDKKGHPIDGILPHLHLRFRQSRGHLIDPTLSKRRPVDDAPDRIGHDRGPRFRHGSFDGAFHGGGHQVSSVVVVGPRPRLPRRSVGPPWVSTVLDRVLRIRGQRFHRRTNSSSGS